MRYDKYSNNGNYYNIYNIYYDTLDNNIIRLSTNKPKFKEKLRLRSYKESIKDDDEVFLEIKRKINGIVTKRRVSLTLSEANKFVNEGIKPLKDDYSSKQIIAEISYFLSVNKVIPKLYLSYQRIALIGIDDPNLRITFDRQIITRREDVSLKSPKYGIDILKDNHYILEIKVNGAIPINLAKILSSYKVYPTSFSKYGEEYKMEVKKHDLY